MTAAKILAALERVSVAKTSAEQQLSARVSAAAQAMIDGVKPRSLAGLRNQIADWMTIEQHLRDVFVEQEYAEALEADSAARNAAAPLQFEMDKLMGEYRTALGRASGERGRTQDNSAVRAAKKDIEALEARQRDAMIAKQNAERRLRAASTAREAARTKAVPQTTHIPSPSGLDPAIEFIQAHARS